MAEDWKRFLSNMFQIFCILASMTTLGSGPSQQSLFLFFRPFPYLSRALSFSPIYLSFSLPFTLCLSLFISLSTFFIQILSSVQIQTFDRYNNTIKCFPCRFMVTQHLVTLGTCNDEKAANNHNGETNNINLCLS